MTATQFKAVQKLDCFAICNAESGLELQSTENSSYPAAMIIQIIEKERAKVLELRTKMGLHRLETDKHRWERWEITVAKLMALDSVRDALLAADAVAAAASPEDLTGKKSILEFIRDEMARLSAAAEESTRLGMFETGGRHRAKAEILVSILSKFSGSAGTQPLTSEETPEPMGNPPVTVPALNPCVVQPSAAHYDWLRSLPMADLEFLSESVLSTLEERGAVVHWSLSGI